MSKRISFIPAAFLAGAVFVSSNAWAQSTVTVNWGTTYQTMDGFGAAVGNGQHHAAGSICGSLLRNLTTARAQQYVSPSSGAGMSLLRVSIWSPGDVSCPGASTAYYDDASVQMLLAANPNLKVWGASWSPGTSWTTGGDLCSPIAPAHYQDFANYLVGWVQHEQGVGIPIYALSVQNEPDYTSCSNQPVSGWSAQNFHDFTSVLSTTLASNGLSSVKIMLPETSNENDLTSEAGTTMSDPTTAAEVSIVATHAYTQNSSMSNPYPSKSFWETEISTFGPFDGSIGDALTWATNYIHPFIVQQAGSGWNWWLLEDGGYWSDNEALYDNNSATYSKRLYAIGQWAKFVTSGWVRIDATANPASGVYLSAFKNPSTGAFAIVAINNNGSTSNQTFTLSGVSASSVTPWVTSASLNLAAQAPVSVSGGFTTTLAAQSITTFVGQSSTAPPPSPCDVNGDGVINGSDVTVEINQALGVNSCTADINRDGVCNVVDVQRVVNAVGGACVSP